MEVTTKKAWRLNEIVVLIVLSVVFAFVYWGWTPISNIATVPFKLFGLDSFFEGTWFLAGPVIGFIIRKPGAAFLGELIAGTIEGFITQWGVTAMLWGAVQGLGTEIIFLIFLYRNYSLAVMLLAGAGAALAEFVLNFFYYQYWTLASWLITMKAVGGLIGGAFWAGLLGYFISKGIVRTGVCANLLSGQTRKV